MKNLFIIVIILFNFNLLASHTWGIDLGVNSAKFKIDGQSGLGGQNNDSGYSIGARYDRDFTEKIGITLGLGLAKYASSYLGNDEGFSPSSGNRIGSVYDISFLNVYLRPLITYKLDRKISLLGGITIEKAIKSQNKIRYSSQDASFQDQNLNLTYGETFLRFSLNLGISYYFSFKVFKKQFNLVPRFMLQHAVSDSYEKNGQSIRGSSIHLSTGILF